LGFNRCIGILQDEASAEGGMQQISKPFRWENLVYFNNIKLYFLTVKQGFLNNFGKNHAFLTIKIVVII